MKTSHLVVAVPLVSLVALHLVDRRRQASEIEELRSTLGGRAAPAAQAGALAPAPPRRWEAPRAAAVSVAEPATASPAAPVVEPPRPPPLQPAELRDRLEGAFLNQPADVRWSDEARRTAETRLPAALPGTSKLQALECRGAMCRIETAHQGVEGYQQFVNAAFRDSATKLWNGGFFSTVLGDPVDGKLVTVAYLAREGEALPRVDELP
jgi:hypothetical protein